jgi:hypothetical protein
MRGAERQSCDGCDTEIWVTISDRKLLAAQHKKLVILCHTCTSNVAGRASVITEIMDGATGKPASPATLEQFGLQHLRRGE